MVVQNQKPLFGWYVERCSLLSKVFIYSHLDSRNRHRVPEFSWSDLALLDEVQVIDRWHVRIQTGRYLQNLFQTKVATPPLIQSQLIELVQGITELLTRLGCPVNVKKIYGDHLCHSYFLSSGFSRRG
ncbi:hypothetical protein A1D30_05575 [Acidovorax sp. GW101-3H11]|nr:hypothetical protein A1D30_05575 [Acidovorax sp. GW101-3H11]